MNASQISALLVLFCLTTAPVVTAQTGVLTGAYVPPDAAYDNDNFTKRVIPYPHLREADVMYKKRVWQVIDLEQKFNQPFYYPQLPIQNRKNLIDLIRMGLREERIIAYRPGANQDDEFQTPLLTQADLDSVLKKTKVIDTYPNGSREPVKVEQVVDLDWELVTRYKIKEEWIWDKQRSERYVRILGIAPMIKETKDDVDYYTELFWLYYPHCREWFASDEAEVYNIFNDAQRRTFEDLFQKRYFSSYIVKEDNAFDRYIANYATGLTALAESERIQQELFNLEHDLWHY